jgi:cysteine desulfurase
LSIFITALADPMIYLDHNATTALDPEVLAAMRPYFLAAGNAESRHSAGRTARRGWESAKETVARVLGAEPSEVIFTSGGTEANNLAVFGLAGTEQEPGHIVSSPFEHPAVAEPLGRLEGVGFAIDRPDVGPDGVANAAKIAARIRDDTRFATLMLANNETGAIQPLAELAALARERNVPVPVHTDAVQAVGRIPVDFHALGVATLAVSAHKFHGPPGVGCLLVRSGVRLGSRLFGGGQQQGRRPGTIAVPLVVGLATALEKWDREAAGRIARWAQLSEHLISGLQNALGADRVILNGPLDSTKRLPQTVNLGFRGLDGDALLMQLDLAGVCASIGSACASGSTRLSPTLLAMRVPDDCLRSSVRFSLGAYTLAGEIDDAIGRVAKVAHALSNATPEPWFTSLPT